MTFRHCVAVDLGASSGRVMLATWDCDRPILTLREMHRFANCLQKQDGFDTWDIDALEAEIDSGDFLRCHRSFLVNMASIQRVDRTDFVLAGDVRVPIGSQNGARARQCFTQWVMDHTWR